MSSKKVALLFQLNNFVGREYYFALENAGLTPDLLISVGNFSASSEARERERTGGRWNPPPIPTVKISAHFDSPSDPRLAAHLKDNNIAAAIQGGIGIIKQPLIDILPFGIINVHPGHLPEYRGNTCPEWALYNGHPVWATAHFIDSGIDTGPIIIAKEYFFDEFKSYHEFRANIYKHNASVLVDAIALVHNAETPEAISTPQNPAKAKYYPPIGEAEFQAILKSKFLE